MTDYDALRNLLHKQGMEYKVSSAFVQKLKEDEECFRISEDEKLWALRNGFYPGKMEIYGLNNNNYQEYVPDYHYFLLHPLNHHFRIWINDKLTLKYILNNTLFQHIMPEYYVYVENDGKYTYLMDFPSSIIKNDDVLLNLLKCKKELVLKPNSGASGGFGFIKLEYKDNNLLENNKQINIERLNYIRDSIRNYIITDYVHQHEELSAIWPYSECTLRIIMCKNIKETYDADEWSCISSFARFGTKFSAGTSNLMSGGIGVGFDFDSGRYYESCFRYKQHCENGTWKLKEHPDSGVQWAGKIVPQWEYVKRKIYEICHYISSLSFFGLDIIITPDGMKLLEINTLPSMESAQAISGPSMENTKIREFFIRKGIREIDGKNLLEAYKLCQI